MSCGTRLFDAARAGDTAALEELLNDEPLILHQVTLTPSESPLHVACLLGHVDFARLLMERNKDLAVERNRKGFTPLHLAASKGYLDVVKHMLRIDREMCCEEDQSGRTPLHCAVIKGKTDVVQELIKAYPETASNRTQRGETLLHLAVLNNQFRALPPLIGFLREQNLDMNELFNSQDEFGQTILHIAVEMQNFQMVKLIVNETSTNVDLSVVNSANLTALDMAVLRRTVDGSVDSKDIEDILRAAATGGGNHNRIQDHRVHILDDNNTNQISASTPLDPKKDEVRLNVVMVVAVLLATLSFQAALNPPGGVWQDWDDTNSQSGSTTQVQRSRISSVDEGESPSPHPPLAPSLPAPISLYIYNLAVKYMRYKNAWGPINMNLGDDKRHTPGKSISRELYPDCFFAFLYACGLCFFFSVFTLFVMAFVSTRFHLYSLYTTLCYSLIFGMQAFLDGVDLVTDTHVSTWLFISVYFIIIAVVGLGTLLIMSERRWKLLTRTGKKISRCCSRLKTISRPTMDNVGFILVPLIAAFVYYVLDVIRHNYGTEGAP